MLITELFPPRKADISPPTALPAANDNSGLEDVAPPAVSEADLGTAVRLLQAKNTAPGPDGISGCAWIIALEALGNRLRWLFDACFETRRFPTRWKTGHLVLLRKPGRPAHSPAAYRPIVLLDEAGKLLERIVVHRLLKHLASVGPDLAKTQFSFRKGHSTIGAILRVKALSDETVAHGGVLLGVLRV